MKQILLLLFAITLLPTGMSAQELIVNFAAGGASAYATEEIRSITFPENDMRITLQDGTEIDIDIADIASYQFDTGLSSEDAEGAESALTIFPNPASERVQIAYTGKAETELQIDILDGTGRLAETVYQGAHHGRTEVIWQPRGLAKGNYLCRLIAGGEVHTGKIILQ